LTIRVAANGRGSLASISTITAISSAAVTAIAPERRRKRSQRLVLGFGLAVTVVAAVAWRVGASAHASTASAPEVAALAKSANVTVELRSMPSNAQLFLDGERLVGNPSSRMLPKDLKIHVLRAESDGYQKATAEFTVTKGDTIELHLEKLEAPPKGQPSVSNPRHAVKASKSKLAASAANCAQPFFIDSDGIKKLRPACL
jgi:hypothetical protein